MPREEEASGQIIYDVSISDRAVLASNQDARNEYEFLGECFKTPNG